MGTRGFIGFVIDGAEKIAYNHFDSYPSGLGCDVLRWLRATVEKGDDIRPAVRALRVVDPTSSPTEADIEQLRRFANHNVGSKEITDWYVLLRETQGNAGLMLEAGVIEDAGNFPVDSLFAEWGYVVDLDANVFEAYQGFQHVAHQQGRFANRTAEHVAEGYYPCRLAGSWPLSGLPDDAAFLTQLEGEEEPVDLPEPVEEGEAR